MPRLVCDTSFFVGCYFPDNKEFQLKARDLVTKNKNRYVSAVTLKELNWHSQGEEGKPQY